MQPSNPNDALCREWLHKAANDLVVADRSLAPPVVLEAVTFHSQQAAEKSFKGYLALHGRPHQKLHHLPLLLAECVALDGGFATLQHAATTLNRYLTAGRYPDVPVQPTLAEVQQARTLAGEVFSFVLTRVPPAAHP